MGQHKRLEKRQPFDLARVWRGSAEGAVVGLAAAAVCLAVGAIGVGVALLTGTRVELAGLVPGVALLLAGWGAAGAFAGAFAPWRRDPVGRFIIGVLAAAIVCAFLTRSTAGPIAQWDGGDVTGIVVMALVFGLPLGWELGKAR